jgi:hypothetical protein
LATAWILDKAALLDISAEVGIPSFLEERLARAAWVEVSGKPLDFVIHHTIELACPQRTS